MKKAPTSEREALKNKHFNELYKLVEVLLLAYELNHYFSDKFAWEMWANVARKTIDSIERSQ